MYCIQNIYSYNRSLYAEQNEDVSIISRSAHVAIVEGKRGRFPVLFELLSDNMVVVVVEEPKPLRAPKTKDKDQLNMFGL